MFFHNFDSRATGMSLHVAGNHPVFADNPSLIRFIHKFSKLALNHRYIAVKIFRGSAF